MTRPLTRIILPLLSAALSGTALSSCGRSGDRPVPKPEGWPRIEMPAAEYTADSYGGVELLFNSRATVESREAKEGGWWIDVTYPGISEAKIYLSLVNTSGAEEMAKALANRHERMELNTAGASTELTQLTSEGGWECELAVTRSSVTTPVQLLAHDGKGRILSGALYLTLPAGTAPDSIAPVVSAVGRDLTETLKHLRAR